MSKNTYMTYALKDGNIISINDVESGLKCESFCPACGERLVAKKGKKRVHHFAHVSGKNCEYGYETSLHLAAKEIISKAKKFVVPDVYVEFSNSYKRPELISKSKTINIDNVLVEHKLDSIKPDIILEVSGKLLIIEIYVTHKIDDIKLDKIKSLGISTIEIDLSKYDGDITTEKLEHILLNDVDEKKWVYNTVADACLQNYIHFSEILDVTTRGLAIHVDNCPIKKRVWKGKVYANYIDDCLYCEYCISHTNPGGIVCSGKEAISKYKDFKIPREVRIKDRNDIYFNIRETAFDIGNCPYCGSEVKKINGQYGIFWSCSNYKHCGFKVKPKSNSDLPDLSILRI